MNMYDFQDFRLDLIEAPPGLYSGKCGGSILCYLHKGIYPHSNADELGLEILNGISDDIESFSNLNFSDGLTGIGWGIEWLSQNSFIDVNTDEILSDFDDTIYKSVLFSGTRALSVSTGTLGRLLYFINRYSSKNHATHRFRRIPIRECIVLLSDEVLDKVQAISALALEGKPLSERTLVDLGHAFFILKKLTSLKVNLPTVLDALSVLTSVVDNLFSPVLSACQLYDRDSLVFLLICCKIYASSNNTLWSSRIDQYLAEVHRLNDWPNGNGSGALHYASQILGRYYCVNDLSDPVDHKSDNEVLSLALTEVDGKVKIGKFMELSPDNFEAGLELVLLV